MLDSERLTEIRTSLIELTPDAVARLQAIIRDDEQPSRVHLAAIELLLDLVSSGKLNKAIADARYEESPVDEIQLRADWQTKKDEFFSRPWSRP